MKNCVWVPLLKSESNSITIAVDGINYAPGYSLKLSNSYV